MRYGVSPASGLSCLARDLSGSEPHSREALCGGMTSVVLLRATLGVVPTVRHAGYIGAWLEVLWEDNRAVIRAASAASKASDFLLAFRSGAADARIESEEAA